MTARITLALSQLLQRATTPLDPHPVRPFAQRLRACLRNAHDWARMSAPADDVLLSQQRELTIALATKL